MQVAATIVATHGLRHRRISGLRPRDELRQFGIPRKPRLARFGDHGAVMSTIEPRAQLRGCIRQYDYPRLERRARRTSDGRTRFAIGRLVHDV